MLRGFCGGERDEAMIKLVLTDWLLEGTSFRVMKAGLDVLWFCLGIDWLYILGVRGLDLGVVS